MKVLENQNIDEAFLKGLLFLIEHGEVQDSRNGKVLVAKTPVTTMYHNPRQRVLFHAKRDANPFFHFLEAIWMLAGRNDAQWISYFNKRMHEYADDGILHGAYGFRWRKHFALDGDAVTLSEVSFDQIEEIVRLLTENPLDRRIVLSMWDPMADLGASYSDHPCNTHVYFRVRDKFLDMTVCNRSNDIIWGAYGANVVHMSLLQEYMAARLGLFVGNYYQVSNNFHLYVDVFIKMFGVDPTLSYTDALAAISSPETLRFYKEVPECRVIDVFPRVGSFDTELPIFMKEAETREFNHQYTSYTLRELAVPMVKAYSAFKQKDFESAKGIVSTMPESDWRLACRQWLERKEQRNAA